MTDDVCLFRRVVGEETGDDRLDVYPGVPTLKELGYDVAGTTYCMLSAPQGVPADVVRRAMERGVDVVFGCDVPCSIASDTLGQLRVMFNVQGYLDGAMERSFSSVIGRRPPVREGLPLLTPRSVRTRTR